GKVEPYVLLLLAEWEAAPRISEEGRPVEDDAPAVTSSNEGGDEDHENDDHEEAWPGAWLASDLSELPRYLRTLCENPPPGYVEALGAAVRRFGRSYNSYGDELELELVKQRLLALGPRANKLLPEVVAWGQRWCKSKGRDSALAAHFGKMLMVLGLEEVPDFIHAAARKDEYALDDFYPRWAAAVPARRVDAFAAAFGASPMKFERAAAWEKLIYDSDTGLDLFVDAIVGSEGPPRVDRGDAIARLVKATRGRKAGPLLTKLTYQLAARLAKKSAWREVLLVLEGMAGLDEKRAELLRRARIADALNAIDTNAPDAGRRTARLAKRYPRDAMVTFACARQLASEAPRAAGELVHAALHTLAADDLVYRKAIFQSAGLSLDVWDKLDVETCYAYLRLASDHFHDRHYDGDVVTSGLGSDPFYDMFAEWLSKLAPRDVAAELEGWRAELAASATLRECRDAELAQHIQPSAWQITWVIAQRLARNDERWRIEHLLEIWSMFAGNELRRTALTSLVWRHAAWQTVFITDERVTPYLAWLIEHAPGMVPSDRARLVFATLLDADRPTVVIDTVQQLEPDLVGEVFLSIVPAYQRLRDWDGAIALLEKLRAVTSVKKPEFVLLAGNIAALQMQASRDHDAEATLDALFAMDWSRFDYQPDPGVAAFAESVLGGDLGAEYTHIFRQYMAMAKFNIACVYARTERRAEAIAALREAVALNPMGYPATKILAEADFAGLREEAGFTDLISSLGGAP
ncbi:MAG TPA: hypothetical protein VK427_02745, partial [Kofleriaceae bacterium]|nr:hypothetical protein [Kofleriaceae bacterium]